ncbi:PorV/PorQ family protein [candidate division KSB1 bacterium]|nr:PorV/PorQ family protein [candidate division KSB1 bacterium]NIR72268.1 PorV/PorQ family protein [candidate division KSB1 bacterium]NIS24239.1 PorV/PorQ family protein [candidate division KSB1 bacterium]NIT71153.1 PorV/PorQ family protein [candidate division KSB1 bacterium]NIU24858.1 PorV/PorQ family protein [candidate division KSB1 bacterium]
MICRAMLLLTFSLVVCTGSLLGGDFTTAKYAGEFLNLGVGGRSLGMGGAFVSVARDVTSGYWNPAGLAFLDYPEFMLMHSSQFSGVVNYDYGSFGLPVGKRSSFGISIFRVGVDDIKETALTNPDVELGETYVDENGQLVRNTPFVENLFNSTDYAFYLTYSKRVSDGFSYGGNVKFVNRSLGDNSAWGVGFDLGFIFNPVSRLIIGVNLQDVTSTMIAWDTGRRELITPSIRTGVSYPLTFSAIGGKVQPAVDFVFRFENRRESAQAHIGNASLDLNLGWEYKYRDAFAIRVGSSEVGQFTAGAGLRFPKLHIDYAFLGHEDLGNTHRISARLTLEEPRFKRGE